MKLCLLIVCLAASVTFSTAAHAQLAPGGDLRSQYTQELKKFEQSVNAGQEAEARRIYGLLLQIQDKHKQQLKLEMRRAEEPADKQEIADRMALDAERVEQLKEIMTDIQANKQEIMEELNAFLEE